MGHLRVAEASCGFVGFKNQSWSGVAWHRCSSYGCHCPDLPVPGLVPQMGVALPFRTGVQLSSCQLLYYKRTCPEHRHTPISFNWFSFLIWNLTPCSPDWPGMVSERLTFVPRVLGLQLVTRHQSQKFCRGWTYVT